MGRDANKITSSNGKNPRISSRIACGIGLSRDGDSSQLLLDASQKLRIWFGLDFLNRIPNAGLATLVSTMTALLITMCEDFVAGLTGPPDAASGFPENTFLPFDWWLCITRIAIRVFLQFGWIPRALLAADVVALSTLGGIPDEQGLADMASTTDTLTDGPPDEILTPSSGRDGKNDLLALGSHRLRLSLGLLGFLLGFGGRIAEALLAAQVVAFGTELLGTKAGQAAVAVAANTHADGLVDTLSVLTDGTNNPLFRLEGQAVLLE